MARQSLEALRQQVEANCEYVGERFPEEARKIHYGEVKRRDIYGEAKDEEAKALDASVAVEPIVAPLRPAESLLEAARERDARAIVVGGSGDRPILGAILGSVPHKLLHRSTVPVLVVPTAE